MKTSSSRFGGIEKIKTVQAQGVRSAPSNTEAGAYLELYMLLKKKERLERRDDQGQLEGLLKKIKGLRESMPPQLDGTEAAREKETGNKPPKKDWKVMKINY